MTQQEKEGYQRQAISLKLQGTQQRLISGILELTKKEYLEVWKPDTCPLKNRRAGKRAAPRKQPVAKATRPRVERKLWEVLKYRVQRFQGGMVEDRFTHQDVIQKFGDAPTCYLTGAPIDYQDGKTYELDHFIPRCKGGSSKLDNLRLCAPVANRMKSGLYFWVFIDLCRTIANHIATKP